MKIARGSLWVLLCALLSFSGIPAGSTVSLPSYTLRTLRNVTAENPTTQAGLEEHLSAGHEENIGASAPAVAGYAGLEELTPEKVRETARELAGLLESSLEVIQRTLISSSWADSDTRPNRNSVQERMREVKVRSSELNGTLRLFLERGPRHAALPEPARGLLLRTFGHELKSAVIPLAYADVYTADSDFDLQNLAARVEAMARAIVRVRAVLEELSSLAYVRPTRLGHKIILALSTSESVRPRWFALDNFLHVPGPELAGVTGPTGLALDIPSEGLVNPEARVRIVSDAREIGADRIALVPLLRTGVMRIHPYVNSAGAREDERPRVREYLDRAGRELAAHGVEFGPLTDVPLSAEEFKRPGFVVTKHRGVAPSLAPAEYPTFSLDRLLRLSPAGLIAKVLHPKLNWKFLDEVQVRKVEEVVDEITGVRYLILMGA